MNDATPPLVFALDSTAYIFLEEAPELVASAAALVEAGRIQFERTHVQADEVVPGDDRYDHRGRDVLEAIAAKQVPTVGVVLGISRLGAARFASDEAVKKFRTKGRGKMKDALIGATAAARCDVLVTDDKKLRQKLTQDSGSCEAWDFDTFRAFIEEEAKELGIRRADTQS